MNEKQRREKQADAILASAPEIAGRQCDMRSVGRMLALERLGNKYFGGDQEQGDIEAMTQVFYIATRTREEMSDISDAGVIEFADEVTMEDVNAFGRYFESVLDEINASGAEPEKTPGKRKAAKRRTGSRQSSASG